MRRKVRGTVSGIYRVLKTPSRLRAGSSCLQQNGFCAFFFWLQNTPQIAYITPLAHYASACALRALCFISRDNLTMNQWEHSEVVTPDARPTPSQ